jgi:hypothetical protein
MDAQHSNFIDRLRYVNLARHAEYLARGQQALTVVPNGHELIARRASAWPQSRRTGEQLQELLANAFDSLQYAYSHDSTRPLDAGAFARLAQSVGRPVIALDHEIDASRWERSYLSVVRGYLKFWKTVAAVQPPTLVIAFFCVKFTPDVTPEARAAIVAALRGLEARSDRNRKSPVAVHTIELGSVTPADVEAWFEAMERDYGVYLDRECQIFPNGNGLPMKKIRQALRLLLQKPRTLERKVS